MIPHSRIVHEVGHEWQLPSTVSDSSSQHKDHEGNQLLDASPLTTCKQAFPVMCDFSCYKWRQFSIMVRILLCSSVWYCILGDVFWSSLTDMTVLWFTLRDQGFLTLVLLGHYIYLTIFQQFPLYRISAWVWALWNILPHAPFFLLISSLDTAYWSRVIAKLLWRLMEKASFTLSAVLC